MKKINHLLLSFIYIFTFSVNSKRIIDTLKYHLHTAEGKNTIFRISLQMRNVYKVYYMHLVFKLIFIMCLTKKIVGEIFYYYQLLSVYIGSHNFEDYSSFIRHQKHENTHKHTYVYTCTSIYVFHFSL